MTETAKPSPKHRSPAFKPFWEALLACHKKRLSGVIADHAAQNMAICWLFDNNFSRDECLTLYAEQVKELKPNGWRSMVSWLSVKKQIPDWVSQGKPIIEMKKGTNNNEKRNIYENIRNDKGNSKSTLDGIRRTIRAKSEPK